MSMSAQTYADPVALARIAHGMCPECGNAVRTHATDPRFWLPGFDQCSLRADGVRDRIAHGQKLARTDTAADDSCTYECATCGAFSAGRPNHPDGKCPHA